MIFSSVFGMVLCGIGMLCGMFLLYLLLSSKEDGDWHCGTRYEPPFIQEKQTHQNSDGSVDY